MSSLGIEVRRLCKSFSKRKGLIRARRTLAHALKDVSFEVAVGETYGLLGPNGSGKSTLIRVLSTLLVPDSGEVRVFGFRLPGEESEVRRRVGRVSVDAAFYKKLSARENLLYSAYLYGMEREPAERRAMEILESLGLDGEKFTDPLEEMSRGMQQKVAITRALLVNPPLLLLDEPTTGLYPKSKRDVQTFLEHLRSEHGTTILLTSHDMAETERLCARIGFIAGGGPHRRGRPHRRGHGRRAEARRRGRDARRRLHRARRREARRRRGRREEEGGGGGRGLRPPGRGEVREMEHVLRQTWAFFFRDYQLTRRYFSWVVVFTFYAVGNSATVVLIGVAAGDRRLTLMLMVGVMLWGLLSVVFQEIANSITYERWEGTLEYTFMAPVSRVVHLAGVSLWATFYAVVRAVVIVAGMLLFVDLDLSRANWGGIVAVLAVSSAAFIGLGLMAAVLPVFSPERGAEATNIFQGVLLLVSGVYYPVEVLPRWLQPLSVVSPATYALSACRKLVGIGDGPEMVAGVPLSACAYELTVLTLMGIILIPLGLYVFALVESRAKRTGKLKRTG